MYSILYLFNFILFIYLFKIIHGLKKEESPFLQKYLIIIIKLNI